MENLKKIWNWLNGKKTNIGAFIFFFNSELIPIIFKSGNEPEWLNTILEISIKLFVYAGLLHKTGKAVKK